MMGFNINTKTPPKIDGVSPHGVPPVFERNEKLIFSSQSSE